MEKRTSLFKNKNFTLTFLGALVSNIASLFYSFAVSFYVLEISNNNALLQGTYLGVCGITYGIVTLFGGVLADKFNKAKIMYLCDFIKGALIVGISCLLFINNNDLRIVLLFVMGVLSNVIAAIFSPASSSLIPLIVEDDRLLEANSYRSALQSFQSVVGAILAAILYSFLNPIILFIVVGILYLLSGLSEIFIKYDFVKNESKLTVSSVFCDLKEGAKYIFDYKPLLTLIILCLFVNFFLNPPFAVFLPYFIKTDLANSTYMLSNIMTPESFQSVFGIFQGAGAIIISILISKKDFTGKAHKNFTIALSGLTIMLFIMFITYFMYSNNIVNMNFVLVAFLFVGYLIGTCCTYTNIPISTTLQKMCDKNKLGKVSACMDFGSQALIPLSSFIGGLFITYFGSNALLLFCFGGYLIATTICIFNKSIKRL